MTSLLSKAGQLVSPFKSLVKQTLPTKTPRLKIRIIPDAHWWAGCVRLNGEKPDTEPTWQGEFQGGLFCNTRWRMSWQGGTRGCKKGSRSKDNATVNIVAEASNDRMTNIRKC